MRPRASPSPSRLTRLLHEGGLFLTEIYFRNNDLRLCLPRIAAAHFVLFGIQAAPGFASGPIALET